jgi:acyl carrier protein
MSTHPSHHPDIVAAEIAAMLALILARTAVAPDDDFFDLGGDSLSATELMVAIEARYRIVVDPVEIFEEPKIRQFAHGIALLLARDAETANVRRA